MWDLYEKRIDQYLQAKHFDTRRNHQHSPVRQIKSVFPCRSQSFL